MERGRARHHRVEGRVRLAGPPLQVPVGHRPRHHRHAVERLPLLRPAGTKGRRSEEHTSELQSLIRISYAVFCLQKKTNKTTVIYIYHITSQQKISHYLPS